MLSLALLGDDALAARLDAFPDALRGALAAKAETLALALADAVKLDKLSGQVLAARSGALRDSIAADVAAEGEAIVATVGSVGGVKYAAIQEYGGKTAAKRAEKAASRLMLGPMSRPASRRGRRRSRRSSRREPSAGRNARG